MKRFPFISRERHEEIMAMTKLRQDEHDRAQMTIHNAQMTTETAKRELMAERHMIAIDNERLVASKVQTDLEGQIARLTADLADTKDGLKKAIDRLCWLGVGTALFEKSEPVAEPEPQPEAGDTDETPRGAILRNPRRFVRNATMKDTIQHNKSQVRQGVEAIASVMESQARAAVEARAEKNAQAIPSTQKVG